MSIRCGNCGRDYDITLFEFERSITCLCGETVTLKHEQVTDAALHAQRDENLKIKEIRLMADRIASLIISTDYPMIDIEIEKQKFREKISELFPEKIDLYDLIYEPRFRRLKEQFRNRDML